MTVIGLAVPVAVRLIPVAMHVTMYCVIDEPLDGAPNVTRMLASPAVETTLIGTPGTAGAVPEESEAATVPHAVRSTAVQANELNERMNDDFAVGGSARERRVIRATGQLHAMGCRRAVMSGVCLVLDT